jgi:integrase/recombinase XerD
MTTYNAENEREKRHYFTFQREAKQRSEASIDAIAKALNRFEVYTRFKSFRAFRIEQAVAFKNHLARAGCGRKTGFHFSSSRSSSGNLILAKLELLI